MAKAKREAWEIEAGNSATVTELRTYHGTELGAVRAGARRWRARRENETVVMVRRPGCKAVRTWREEGRALYPPVAKQRCDRCEAGSAAVASLAPLRRAHGTEPELLCAKHLVQAAAVLLALEELTPA